MNRIFEERMNEAIDENGVIREGFEDELDSIFKDKEDKIISCAAFVKNQILFADAISKEQEKLQKKKISALSKANWIKNSIKFCIDVGDKYLSPNINVTTRKKTLTKILDESIIPKRYFDKVPAKLLFNSKRAKEVLHKRKVKGLELISDFDVIIK